VFSRKPDKGTYASFRYKGLWVWVLFYASSQSLSAQQQDEELRHILEGLRQVKVSEDGRIEGSS
jgi:hypothetical protein